MSSRSKAKLNTIGNAVLDPHTLSRTLAQLFGNRLGLKNPPASSTASKNRRSIPSKSDIVNRQLCDEAIQYLAPSLEPYKGCTIIDVHPGACLWSASLHDFLKPKRHLLMEPDSKYVQPFIQPLLDRPGSTYRHTSLSGAHPKSYWENYSTILDDSNLMEPRPALHKDDPKLRQLDTSILVTGNLARRYTDVHRLANAVPFSQLILQHLTWAALTNSIFHRSGLVRMLWWIPDMFKPPVVAPIVFGRSALNMGLSLGADVQEIVGVEPNLDIFNDSKSRVYARSPSMVAARDHAIEHRMKADQTQVPKGRPLLKSTRHANRTSEGYKSFLKVPEESLEDFKEAVKSFEARCEEIAESYAAQASGDRSVKTKIMDKFVSTIEYPQCREFIIAAKRPSVRSWKYPLDLDLLCRLINLEARFCALKEKGNEVEPLRARLLAADDRIREYMHSYKLIASAVIDDHLEDQLAFFADPQVMPFDRRRIEPLQAREDDFWPAFPLSLIDVTPVADRDLAIPGLADRREAASTAQQLLKYLYQSRTQPLSWVLDHIAPNAAQDLIPMIPGIADPRKGGRLDPNKFKVRMLSEEMVIALLKAWYEWPFRPSRWELERATYSYEYGTEDASMTSSTGSDIAHE